MFALSPCHVAKEMPSLSLIMFSPRWLRSNQIVTAQATGTVNISVSTNEAYRSRPWSKATKYGEIKVLALRIADKMSEMRMSSFIFYLDKLCKFEESLSFQRKPLNIEVVGWCDRRRVNHERDVSGGDVDIVNDIAVDGRNVVGMDTQS